MNSFIQLLIAFTPCTLLLWYGYDVDMKYILASFALTLAGMWLMIGFYSVLFKIVSSIFNGISKLKFCQKFIKPVVSKISITYIFMALFALYFWISVGSAVLIIAAVFMPGPLIYYGISYLYRRFSKKKETAPLCHETHELHHT